MMISGALSSKKALEAVVAVDHSTIEIVQIARREPTAVQGDQGPKIRRQDRDDREHHPFGAVAGTPECLDHLQALADLLALGLTGGGLHVLAQLLCKAVHVHSLEHFDDGLAAHAGGKAVVAVLFEQLGVAILGQELTGNQVRVLGVDDDVRLAVQDFLEILQA